MSGILEQFYPVDKDRVPTGPGTWIISLLGSLAVNAIAIALAYVAWFLFRRSAFLSVTMCGAAGIYLLVLALFVYSAYVCSWNSDPETGSRLFWLNILAILLYVVGSWGMHWSTQYQVSQRFSDNLHTYFDQEYESLLSRQQGSPALGIPYRSGKVLVLDKDTKTISPLHFFIRRSLRADSPEEVSTLVMVTEGKPERWGDSCVLEFIDYRERVIVGRTLISGNPETAEQKGIQIDSIYSAGGSPHAYAESFIERVPCFMGDPIEIAGALDERNTITTRQRDQVYQTLGISNSYRVILPVRHEVINPVDHDELLRRFSGKRIIGTREALFVDGQKVADRIGLTQVRLVEVPDIPKK